MSIEQEICSSGNQTFCVWHKSVKHDSITQGCILSMSSERQVMLSVLTFRAEAFRPMTSALRACAGLGACSSMPCNMGQASVPRCSKQPTAICTTQIRLPPVAHIFGRANCIFVHVTSPRHCCIKCNVISVNNMTDCDCKLNAVFNPIDGGMEMQGVN